MKPLIFSIRGDIACLAPIRKKYQCPCRAFRHACRFFAVIDSLCAEAAFPHYMLGRTELRHMKRACLDAISASDTAIPQMFNNSIRSSAQSARGTGRSASRVVAMETRRRYKMLAAVRKSAGNMALDMT
jgi:hypothetical protein